MRGHRIQGQAALRHMVKALAHIVTDMCEVYVVIKRHARCVMKVIYHSESLQPPTALFSDCTWLWCKCESWKRQLYEQVQRTAKHEVCISIVYKEHQKFRIP